MNKFEELVTYQDLRNIWMDCPWGVAVIGIDGIVRAVNPTFEACTGLSEIDVVGKGEEIFEELVLLQLSSGKGFTRTRQVSKSIDLSAIHYFSEPSVSDNRHVLNSSKTDLLRDPLTSIYGFAELLLSQNYDEETRRNLTSTLLEQADLMLNIINNYLDDSAK